MLRRHRCALTLLATLAPALAAGPLTPPPGPIASTMRTLLEVEARTPIGPDTTPGDADSLYRITQPGSYYLTGNVAGVPGKSGIEIYASGVTIDLGGFQLDGTASGVNSCGITDNFLNLSNVTIRNGTLIGWQRAGIELTGAGARIESVTASHNGVGIDLGFTTVVTRCIARNNADDGISTGAYSVVEACTASGNGGNGILAGGSSTVRGCSSGNNSQNGINSYDNGHVVDCSATGNGLHGIKAHWASFIDRCHASTNHGDGINVGNYSTVTNNICRSNGSGASGGAGIRLDSTTVRTIVRGNNCVQNDWGIRVDAASNLIIGNSCTMNTINFEIVSGNRVGAIVTLPTSGAISGNSGGSSAPTDPISNFAF
jgi:hypothetical protein